MFWIKEFRGRNFLRGGRMYQPAFYASEDRRIFISFSYEVVWSCGFGKRLLGSFHMFTIFPDFQMTVLPLDNIVLAINFDWKEILT